MSKKPEGIDPEAWARANEADAECQRNSCKEDACNGFLCVRALRIAILAAVEAERETCARVADSVPIGGLVETNETDLKRLWKYAGSAQAGAIASAIRNRGEG